MNDIELPDFLRKSLANREVIPLIGAGVSMSVKTKKGSKAFPSWSDLLCNAADELEGKDSEVVELQVKREKLQRAAQEAQELLSGRRWFDFLNSQFSIDFKNLDDSCKALPKAIWKLSNRVVTLNYDKVLEWAHEESANLCAFDNSNHEQLAEFARVSNKEMLWHLHGKIEHPKHMVLTPQSYHRLYQEDAEKHYKAALTKFRELISTKIILFIGCSLDDVELLAELVEQNELFDGNTGPHYALVREKDKQTIDDKLSGIDIKTISFSEFGQPLIDIVQQLVECKTQYEQENVSLKADESLQKSKNQPKKHDKIGLFTASPLDKPIDDSNIIAKLKKFKYPIYQQAFTERNLMEADDYSILFLLCKKTSNGLLIEDDNACSDYLAINELEDNLPINGKLTVLITDDLLSEKELEKVDFPLLVLPLLNKQGNYLKILDKLTHQLFKKPDDKHFVGKKEIQSVRISGDLLKSLNPENRQCWLSHQPILPRDISPIELQGFIGRLSDLADISQKLIKAANGQRLLTIKGSGGLGKTTIAKKVALELANRGWFDAGVYFIDCENISSTNQLEMHIAEAFNLRTADDLFGYLGKHHDQRSRLLIFDNLESLLYLKKADKSKNRQIVDQVKGLLSRTLIYSNVLVTSRESINTEWEDILPFRQMESEEALALFNHLTKDSYLSDEEQEFARRKILEPLLNNNPLAIKLICDGMPKGKRLKELRQELEEDFFGKVKEEDLTLMFDNEVDANINRQESLYVSILYSYQTLSESQRRTFESFSLFPDGIDLDSFKRLVAESKNTKKDQKENRNKKPISDKDITVLSNKSLVEEYNGFYTLQSVIQRFAHFQFEQHTLKEDKLELFRQSLRYNQQLMKFVRDLNDTNKKAIFIFSSLFNNMLASISYGTRENVLRNENELEDYLKMVDLIGAYSSSLSLVSEFLSVLKEIDIEHLITEKNREQLLLAWQLIEVSAMYYKGDFDTAYNQLKTLISSDLLTDLSGKPIKGRVLESIIYRNAQHLYTMEGEALNRVFHDIKFDSYSFISLVTANVQTGMNLKPLLSLVCADEDYFEAQRYLNDGINLNQIDEIIEGLHENQHLERVSLTYIKSRDFYVSYEFIDKLVNVNPYTRGLKKLMYAFACEHKLQFEENDTELKDKAIDYYQSALRDLNHIKFYYAQALYFYAKFLKCIGRQEFETVYEQGLELTEKHYYRYWQHRFLLLKQPTLGRYRPEDYLLPGNPDISPLIDKQIKFIKKKYGTSLNPFS
ncbi:NB-ARC domain-containing protein [Idiomarina loihiensis]|uniref:SIR2 family protein n=1 Tax=Idiomarina TaxID=135575 RepID=UPI000D9ACD57|nr:MULTISPECIES: SIR2 family protein [Idiomarina]PWW36465.1 NB-ARC domain-containing protein [Idiomarina loihiensis]TDP46477.1 NB-ARC domain-containing protein [Idiomarina loihiensis]TDS22915.1 NB-ARC domain-containing protein [Idiomarina sp. H2]